MVSVTQRVKQVVQPTNGFLDPGSLTHVRFRDNKILGKESVQPSTVGSAVDYLSRLMSGDQPGEAFMISLLVTLTLVLPILIVGIFVLRILCPPSYSIWTESSRFL